MPLSAFRDCWVAFAAQAAHSRARLFVYRPHISKALVALNRLMSTGYLPFSGMGPLWFSVLGLLSGAVAAAGHLRV